MTMKNIPAIKAIASRLAQTANVKSDEAILKSLKLTKKDPDNNGDFAWIIIPMSPRNAVTQLKLKGFEEVSAGGVNAFKMSKGPVTLLIEFAEDMEEDELEMWDLTEDDNATMISVVKSKK